MKNIKVLISIVLLLSGCSYNKVKDFCNQYNCKKIDLLQNKEFEKMIYWDLELATVFFNSDDILNYIENKIETLEKESGTEKKINDYTKCREHLEALFLISDRVNYFSLDVELLSSKIINLLESGDVKILDKKTNKFKKKFIIFDKTEDFEMPEISENKTSFLMIHRCSISHSYRYYCFSDGRLFFSTRDYFRFPYYFNPVIYPEIYKYPDNFEINPKFDKISKQ